MAKDTFIMDKITIAYDELIAGKDPKNPQTPYTQYHMVKTFVNNNGLGYDSLTEALQALDKSIQPTDTPGEAHPLRWFPTVTVCIGPGTTWVSPQDFWATALANHKPGRQVHLAGDEWGDVMRSPEFEINPHTNTEARSQLGRIYDPSGNSLQERKASWQFGEVKIVGMGQGASTVRGSMVLNIYNLMQLQDKMDLSQSKPLLSGDDSVATKLHFGLHHEPRLIIQNIFWVGKLSVFVIPPTDPFGTPLANYVAADYPTNWYPDYAALAGGSFFDEPIIPANYIKTASTPPSPSTDGPKVIAWQTLCKIEVLIINLWVELGSNPIYQSLFVPKLNTPLFDIGVPALFRLFVSQSNFISYSTPGTQNPPIFRAKAQVINDSTVTDTFIQSCSFSSRTFNAPASEFKCVELLGNGKVSIVSSQCTGMLDCQSNKLALFNCYLLGTGLSLNAESGNPTTKAIRLRQPDGLPASRGYNRFPTGPRLIMSNVTTVCHTAQFWAATDLGGGATPVPPATAAPRFPWEIVDASGTGPWTGTQPNLKYTTTTFYQVFPDTTVVFASGGGTGAVAFALVSPAQNITGVVIIDGGSGYTSAPTVSFTSASTPPGSGAIATASINGTGQVTSVTVTNGGSGFKPFQFDGIELRNIPIANLSSVGAVDV